MSRGIWAETQIMSSRVWAETQIVSMGVLDKAHNVSRGNLGRNRLCVLQELGMEQTMCPSKFGTNRKSVWDQLCISWLNFSAAFIRVLCAMWQGQPMKYMVGVFTNTLVRMEFLFSKLTDVLSTETPTQLWTFHQKRRLQHVNNSHFSL